MFTPTRRRKRRRHTRPRHSAFAAAEVLEERRLLTHFSPVDLGDGHGPKFIGDGFTTVTEDFSDNPNHEDPATVGGAFDALEAQGDRLFTHTHLGGAGIISINDADIPFDQVEQGRHHVFALVGTDEIAFNGIHPDYHVSAARVDAIFTDGTMQVEFHGANGVITLTPSSNNQWETLLVTRGTIIPNTSTELGPISQVVLRAQGTFAYFDNVRILIDQNFNNRNFPPNAVVDSLTVVPNVSGQPVEKHTIDVLSNDDDPELDPISLVSVTSPTNGVAVIDDGRVDYTPNVGFHGRDSFEYTIEDDQGNQDTATVNVLVNSRPVATGARYEFPRGATGTITLDGPSLPSLGADADGDVLTLEIIRPPRFGTINLEVDGSLTFSSTLPEGEIRDDSFSYVFSDGFEQSNEAIAVIADDNRAPVAVSDWYEFEHATEGPILGRVRATDADGDSLTFEVVSSPAHALLKLHDDGSFEYYGGPEYIDWRTGVLHNRDVLLRGSDSFTFRAIDSEGAVSNVATVDIIVPNEPPRTNQLAVTGDGGQVFLADSVDSFRVGVNPDESTASATRFAPVRLSGDNVVLIDGLQYEGGFPNQTTAQGRFDLTLDYDPSNPGQSELRYEFQLMPKPGEDQTIQNVIQVELRRGTIGERGPLVSILYSAPAGSGDFSLDVQTGTVTQDDLAVLFEDFVADLRDGNIYINILTNAGRPGIGDGAESGPGDFHTTGELRGQIIPVGSGTYFESPGPLWNDSDPWFDRLGRFAGLDPLQMIVVDPPKHGLLVQGAPPEGIRPLTRTQYGAFTYYPRLDFEGVDTFTYVASDGHLASQPTTVSINVVRESRHPSVRAGRLTNDFFDVTTQRWSRAFTSSGAYDLLDLSILANDFLPPVTADDDSPGYLPNIHGLPLIVRESLPFGDDDGLAEPFVGDRYFAYAAIVDSVSFSGLLENGMESNIAGIRLRVTDIDSDGDGLLNAEEGVFINVPNELSDPALHDPNVRGSTCVDTDGDGVNNRIEAGAPNNGDGNNDGEFDIRQQHVTSLPGVNGQYVTIVAPEGSELTGVALNNPTGGPSGIDFPIGRIEFEIRNDDPLVEVTVDLILHGEPVFESYYKFGRTRDNPTPHWYEFLFDGTTGAELINDDEDPGIERVILHFRDGERGDDDLTVNGTIVDPGGPVIITGTPTANADLSGEYTIDGRTATIEQAGDILVFTNEHGSITTGRFTGLNQIIADGWEGGLVAEIQGGHLKWANGTMWAVTQLAGDYTIDGLETKIVQMGTQLTFINERGDIANGRLVNDRRVIAAGWEGGLIGEIIGNRIAWGNGTTWSAPDLAGEYAIGGLATNIEQAGNSLTFLNEHGDASRGWIVGPDEVFADDWDIFGKINRARIEWTNGTVWNTPQISGSYLIGEERTRIFQHGASLTFVNERFESSSGQFLSETQVIADDWGGLIGNIVGNRIEWTNGTVWSAPELAGEYEIDGRNVTIEQLGNALTFTNEHGSRSIGRRLSETRVVADDWGRLIGEKTDSGIAWSNGTTWNADVDAAGVT